jgi:cytochrome b561
MFFMPYKNTPETYGHVAKVLHWLIALAVLAMMVMGTFMDDIPDKILRFQIYGIHKALGITVLVLMLGRLVWKLIHWGLPHHNLNHKPWEQKLAGVVHWGFYALLLVMPLSGWLLTGAAGSTISWFGFFSVPNIALPDQELREAYGEIHEIVGLLIWGALALHVGGALKHVFLDKDDTLRRMLPLIVAMVLIPSFAFADDTPPEIAWKIEREQSQIIVTATQEESPFRGKFQAFDGEIVFNPEAPQLGRAKILIDLASFESGNKERDTTVREKEWFDVAAAPTAQYLVRQFEKTEKAGHYIARGSLLLRGLERALDIPFVLSITEEENRTLKAHARAKFSFNRLAFEVGAGQWADPSMVGTDVEVFLDIFATAKKP